LCNCSAFVGDICVVLLDPDYSAVWAVNAMEEKREKNGTILIISCRESML
jgi:hypothetical protein